MAGVVLQVMVSKTKNRHNLLSPSLGTRSHFTIERTQASPGERLISDENPAWLWSNVYEDS